MPGLKLTKSTIDALPTPKKDIVYWDSGCLGFGLKITPKRRKVFILLYRAGGAGMTCAQIHDRPLWSRYLASGSRNSVQDIRRSSRGQRSGG